MSAASHGLRAVAAAAALVVLTGCAASAPPVSGAPAVPAAPSPVAGPLVGEGREGVLFECGAASALEGVLYRTRWERSAGEIDDAVYAARLDALEQAWTYLAAGEAGLTEQALAVSEQARAGTGLDDVALQDRIGALQSSCWEQGAGFAMGALPGMGG